MMLEQQQAYFESYQQCYHRNSSMAFQRISPAQKVQEPPRGTPKRRPVNFHSIADLVGQDDEHVETSRKTSSPDSTTSLAQSIAADMTSLIMTPSPCKSTTSSVDSGRSSPATTTSSSPSPCSSPSSDSARSSPSPTAIRPKKTRTIFKPNQVALLEQVFSQCQYPEPDLVERLASDLDTKEAKIKVWFQNKRARWRKRPVDNTHTMPSQDQSPWLPGVMSPLPYQHNIINQQGYRVSAGHMPVHPMYQQYVLPMMPHQQRMTPHVSQQGSPMFFGPHAQMLQNASTHYLQMSSSSRTPNLNTSPHQR